MEFFFNDERTLLNRIKSGDEQAMRIVWDKYTPELVKRVKNYMYKQPEAMGAAEDYAHDALLLLFEKAQISGAELLKNEHTKIKWWLLSTAEKLICNAQRKQNKFGNRLFEPEGDNEEELDLQQRTAMNESDPELNQPDEYGQKTLIEVVNQFVAQQPEPLQTLIRLHFMDGIAWADLNQLMEDKFQKQTSERYWKDTFWDRKHKDLFINQFINHCKKYGYDLRK